MCAIMTTLYVIPKAHRHQMSLLSAVPCPPFIDLLNTVDNNKDTKRDAVHGTDMLKPRLLGGGLCCKQLIFKRERK